MLTSSILNQLRQRYVLEPSVVALRFGFEQFEFARMGAAFGGFEVGLVGHLGGDDGVGFGHGSLPFLEPLLDGSRERTGPRTAAPEGAQRI